MPQRPWVARTNAGMHPTTRQYVLAAGEVPEAGDFVHLDASAEIIRTVAADPTPLLGLTESSHDGEPHVGTVLVTVFTNDVILAMEGDRAPLLTDINEPYEIARDAAGVWTVDTSAAVNTRVHVVDVDLGRNLFFVKILAAHRQSPE